MEFEQTETIVYGDEMISVAWWVFILQGLLGVVFGGFAMLFPGFVVRVLGMLLGIIIVLYSLSIITQSIVCKDCGGRKVFMIILGVMGIIIGIIALMDPMVLGVTIAIILGLWAFISGFSALFTAFTGTEYRWYRIIFFAIGMLFIAFGVYVIIYPLALTAALIWVMGLFALVIGIATIVLGFIMQVRMKRALNEYVM